MLQAMTHNYPRVKGYAEAGFRRRPVPGQGYDAARAFARNEFGLGHAAMLVNEGLLLHVVDDLRRRYDLANMTSACSAWPSRRKATISALR